ncbi:MAG: 3-methyl-2-oxobutanoate hydroxymethyltransferase [Gammaproteobacteria bacterium]|nr:3-methyl-2-oxobutanoate hydroxymethyltransferase [Gammaproteobacteria bacterium]
MADTPQETPVTLAALLAMQQRGEKIACLTTYDASFTRVLEAAGVDMFIIGDSLGMVLMGYESTVPVTMDDMLHHAANVARVGRSAYRVVDLPYRSYETPAQALANARRLVDEGGAHMVKLEGGTGRAAVVEHLVRHDIPVCGHIGLLPQSVEEYGGYRVQGRDAAGAAALLADATALENAGAGMLVIECIPAVLAARVTGSVSMPVIGIGAGPDCDGQVLVLYDMLGMMTEYHPRFVKDFLQENGSIHGAVAAYVAAVKAGSYPTSEHSY